jgi:glycosyltransferase involved in cell wall biosynthesis
MKVALFANTDWYLYNFRLSTALHLQRQGHDVVLISPPGEYGSRFSTYGLRWVTLPMDRASLNPFRECLTLLALVKLLRRERPDLLHSFTVKSAIYGAIAAKLIGVPALVSAIAGMGHVFSSQGLKARLLRPWVRLLMRGTLGRHQSLLVVQNPDDAEVLVESNIVPREHIRVILSSGVNTKIFQPRHTHSPAGKPLRVLLAARLLWAKGVREFVDASRLLLAQGRRVEFLLAGTPDSGNPQSVPPELVRDWNEAGWVKWLGHVDDMPALLASVDVMALPSYYREGVPKSLIEGAASGLALITTDRPGCREVVREHGKDGLIVSPRDSEDLARLVARLDDDRSLLVELGRQARRTALLQFDENSVIERTMAVYAELIPTSLGRRAA